MEGDIVVSLTDRTDKTYRMLFLLGLVFLLTGQLLLAQGRSFVASQAPIDFAHWFLLLGVTLLVPKTVTFPPNIFSYIGMPLALIGIVATIGMCVLDFIWWSFPTKEMHETFTNHITQIPSIWKPFITIGPSSKVFNMGLLFLSFNYFKKVKLGVILIIIGDLILWHLIPLPYRLVLGYSFTLIGFSVIFLKKDSQSEQLQNA